MKIGKTKEERRNKLNADIERRQKKVKWFAWFPVCCDNTDRTVWLEYVITYEKFSWSWLKFYRYHEEIV